MGTVLKLLAWVAVACVAAAMGGGAWVEPEGWRHRNRSRIRRRRHMDLPLRGASVDAPGPRPEVRPVEPELTRYHRPHAWWLALPVGP
jgi:hypothetical protein